MCGICGLLVRNSQEDQISLVLHRMNNRLKHRGPDDEGFALFSNHTQIIASGNDTNQNSLNSIRNYAPKVHIDDVKENAFRIGFGHRRLSVIDLSDGGHQPMCTAENSDVWITCNGEIYNYVELRDELHSLGYSFHTNSDIEVLLNAYLCWGTKCLDRLNGMWAFVIFDKQKGILFGARDRFGVKPLYYTLNKYHFAFASEHKSLLEMPSYLVEVNQSAIFPHLAYGNVELEPESFFKNIFELMPSHSFVYNINSDEFSVDKYYSLPINSQNPSFNGSDFLLAKDKMYNHIENAVKLRLRSDVPVGFCLSGGLDSSTIVSISNELNRKQQLSELSGGIKAFTAGNNSLYDESNWAKLVVDNSNVDWVNTIVTADTLFDELESIVYHQDVPLFSTSTYAQNRVMKSAKEHGITILLDGQGGDEIFAGYPTFYTSYFNQLLKKFDFKTLFNEFSNLKNSPTSFSIYLKSLMKLGLDGTLSSSQKKTYSTKYKPEFSLISPELTALNQDKIRFSGEFSSKGLNELLSDYCTNYYLKNLLRWEDRCSMQYSIESRTPFSDDINLIEYAFSLPANYKIHQGWSKYIMRQAIEGVVPDPIRFRKDKKGFSIPQTAWLMEKQAKIKEIYGDLRSLDTFHCVDHQKIEKEWNVIFSDAKNFKQMDLIFRYINFLIWLKLFVAPNP
ncbi:MAG: asparagine synthase (glutamine-hydrolyzing) [Bacteroidota bacterium]